MTDLRKAAEMALEALEDIFGKEKKDVGAINALRQALDYPTPEQIALAQQIRPKGKSRIGQALAQEQEPAAVAQILRWVELLKRLSDHGNHMKIPSGMTAGDCYELAVELEQFIKTTPPSIEAAVLVEQEPVAWMYTSHYKGNEWFITRYQSELTTYKADKVQPLYTAPPKREWIELTNEDIHNTEGYEEDRKMFRFAKSLLEKAKEKNT